MNVGIYKPRIGLGFITTSSGSILLLKMCSHVWLFNSKKHRSVRMYLSCSKGWFLVKQGVVTKGVCLVQFGTSLQVIGKEECQGYSKGLALCCWYLL